MSLWQLDMWNLLSHRLVREDAGHSNRPLLMVGSVSRVKFAWDPQHTSTYLNIPQHTSNTSKYLNIPRNTSNASSPRFSSRATNNKKAVIDKGGIGNVGRHFSCFIFYFHFVFSFLYSSSFEKNYLKLEFLAAKKVTSVSLLNYNRLLARDASKFAIASTCPRRRRTE